MTEEVKTNESVQSKNHRPYRRTFRKNTENNKKVAQKSEAVKSQKIEVDVNIEKKVRVQKNRKVDEKSSKKSIANNDEAKVERKNVKAKKVLSEKTEKTQKNIKIMRDRLKIIPLGGIEEVGKNMTVFEYGNDMILVDCGVAFPEDDMLGVDLVIPDFSYLTKNREKLKGMVITHGHEDHIGSIPYVLKEINTPVYGTRLTLGLIKNKLEEHKLVRSTNMKCVKAGDVIKLGSFKIEFIRVNHSIADAVGLAITTPVGTVVHTGDFKVDYTPIDGKLIDLARFAELGKEGVLAST